VTQLLFMKVSTIADELSRLVKMVCGERGHCKAITYGAVCGLVLVGVHYQSRSGQIFDWSMSVRDTPHQPDPNGPYSGFVESLVRLALNAEKMGSN
jgi:hypothetical protein